MMFESSLMRIAAVLHPAFVLMAGWLLRWTGCTGLPLEDRWLGAVLGADRRCFGGSVRRRAKMGDSPSLPPSPVCIQPNVSLQRFCSRPLIVSVALPRSSSDLSNRTHT